jgi:hypothetical protein
MEEWPPYIRQKEINNTSDCGWHDPIPDGSPRHAGKYRNSTDKDHMKLHMG